MMSENPTYTVRWYDAEHTIVICEVHRSWTWNDAYAAVGELNRLSTSVDHGVYTIFHFLETVSTLPKGNAIPNLKSLAKTDQPNDEMTFFVSFSRLLEGLMTIAGNIYGIRAVSAKFRFVESLDVALEQIQQHKREKSARDEAS
jgi:hypothetical protein